MTKDQRGIHRIAAVFMIALAVFAIGCGIVHAYAGPPQYSSDLRDHIVSVDIEGGEYDDQADAISVRPGTELSLKLNFAESRDKQFHREDALTYQLPTGFDYGSQEGTFQINIDDEGKSATMNVPYTIRDGVLTVTWPKEDPNYPLFTEVSNAKFSITFNATYENAEGPVDFGGGVTKTFKLNSSHDVGVKKDGYVGQDGKIHYTVKVTSTGRNDNVHVKDAISGTALTYDKDSFAITGNSTEPEGGTSGNGFDITLPHMESGEVATITYTASIDYSKVTDGGTVEQTENGVSVYTPDQPTPKTDTKNFEHRIQGSDVIYKSGKAADRSNDKGQREVTWTIDANQKHLSQLAGKEIKDEIDAGSRSSMHYSGSGIKVEVFEKGSDTPKETRTVTWKGLNVDTSTAFGWSYSVPESDGNYEYKISYTTSVDMQGKIQSQNVKNNASVSGGASTSGSVDVPSDFNFDVQKSVKSYDAQTATWQITATVPKDGYNNFAMTDTLPTTYLNGKNIHDQLVSDSIQVDGLQGSENYAVDSTDPSKVVLTFFQDTNKTKPGLGKTASDRTITVTLTTRFDPEWLAAVDGGTAADYQKSHENNASAVANDVTKSSSATVTPPLAQSIKKSGAQFGTANINGTSLPIFRYQLVLTGVPDADLDIDDTFDNDLTYCGDPGQWDANLIFGGNQWDQGNRGSINPTFTVNGDSMRIHVPKEALPKNSDVLYSHYKIVYYLMPKDQAALSNLDKRAAANGGTVALDNTAAWGPNKDTATIDYTYDMLDKQLTKEATNNDRKASYTIALNPKALDINPSGDSVTLSDKMTSQDLDVSSIKVTPLDGKPLSQDQIHTDYDHASGIFTLSFPDERALQLTYDTTVTGTGDVTYSNTATLRGQSKEVKKAAKLSHGGGGSASTVSIKLLKHAQEDLNKPLSGATFALYEAKSKTDADFQDSERVAGKDGEVSFTSGDDGIVQVKGGQKTYGWTIEEGRPYYLVETKAPDGYQLDQTPVEFIISDEPDGVHRYTSGFTIDFSNAKKEENHSPLPVFGGPGDTVLYIVGGLLVAAGGAGLLRRRFLGHSGE